MWSRFLLFLLVHIGKKIENVVRSRGVSISWLAKQICCERTNIYSIFRRPSIDTELLLRLSKILTYDFFKDYSDNLEQPQNIDTD